MPLVKSISQKEFLDMVKKTYGENGTKVIEYMLGGDCEEIVSAYPVVFSEHNNFGANMDAEEVGKMLLSGYFLELKNKDGKIRTIRFRSYLNYIEQKVENYKKQQEKTSN